MNTEFASNSNLEQQILTLKKKHNALILAHYYQEGPIQDIADYCGDSLFLAQKGQKSSAPVVVLAGVVFMAESVKLLSPEKTVLVPDHNAGCSLVHGTPYNDFLRWRQEHPDHIAVTYINSSAAVKSISDVICTSSNAEKIINAIPKDRPILFGPDKNLGRFLERQTGRPMKHWPGQCEVHVLFSAKKLFELKQQHPEAKVIAHPECEDVVLNYADFIGSTSKLLAEVENQKHIDEFIVATETGILHQMQKLRPDAKLIQAPMDGPCQCNDCPYMKLNSLEKIKKALENPETQVEIPTQFINKARLSLDRMMKITEGQEITWPSLFRPPLLEADLQ